MKRKKLLSLIMTTLLTFSLAAPAFAADGDTNPPDSTQGTAIQGVAGKIILSIAFNDDLKKTDSQEVTDVGGIAKVEFYNSEGQLLEYDGATTSMAYKDTPYTLEANIVENTAKAVVTIETKGLTSVKSATFKNGDTAITPTVASANKELALTDPTVSTTYTFDVTTSSAITGVFELGKSNKTEGTYLIKTTLDSDSAVTGTNYDLKFFGNKGESIASGANSTYVEASNSPHTMVGAIPSTAVKACLYLGGYREEGSQTYNISVKINNKDVVTDVARDDDDKYDIISFDVKSTDAITVDYSVSKGEYKKPSKDTEEASKWDGKSCYFIWATDDTASAPGEMYYSKITGLKKGETTVVDVKDAKASDNKTVFDFKKQTRTKIVSGETSKEESYLFAWTDAFEKALADPTFTALSTSEKFDYMIEKDIAINPVGSPAPSAASVGTAGEYNFTLIIKGSGYAPVTIKPGTGKYKSEYDSDLTKSGLVDIGGTTSSDPIVYTTYLLEETLKFESDAIKSIKTTSDYGYAVTAEEKDGTWLVDFKSNFYDEVTLKITLNDGTTGYVTVLRKNIRLVTKGDDVFVNVTYPKDEKSKDYAVVVTAVNSAGEKENAVITMPESEAAYGDSTYTASYKAPNLTNASKCYINVIKTNSSSSSYGGTLAGHGLGIGFKKDGSDFKRILNSGKTEA